MVLTQLRKVLFVLLLITTVPVFGEVSSWDVSTFPEKIQEQVTEALRTFKEKRYADALRQYQIIAKNEPRLLIGHIGQGDSLAKLEDFTNAINAYKHALQLVSDIPHANRVVIEPTVQAKIATAYHRNKQLDAANEWFQKAINRTQENIPVAWYIELGQIATKRNNLEKARRYYIDAVKSYPDTITAYNNLGHVLLKLNRADEADAVFRHALTLDKTLASAAYGRGKVAERRVQYTTARQFYEQAIQLKSYEPIFYKSLADVLQHLGEKENKEKVLTQYRKTLAQTYHQQAQQFIQKQQGPQALQLLQKAMQTDANYVPAIEDYAFVQMQMGELASAKKTYKRVLQLAPKSRQALLRLGIIAAKLGNNAEAESNYMKLIRNEPDFMDTYSQLANLRQMLGDLNGAEKAYTMGIHRQPAWAPGYWWRGLVYQKRGESRKAETDFRHAIKLAPNVPYPKDALASLLATENRLLDEALTLAKSAVASDNRPVHIATLALVYFRQKYFDDARREIKKAISQAPKHAYIQKVHSEILKTSK